jgi:hypothetical protein
MFHDPRTVFALLVVCAAVALAMVLSPDWLAGAAERKVAAVPDPVKMASSGHAVVSAPHGPWGRPKSF